MSAAYDELITRVKEAALLRSTASLLGWDQRTMLPPGGVEQRSAQLAQLARLIHERETDPRIGELLAECEADEGLTRRPYSDAGANLRELRHAYDRSSKVPARLVEEIARTSAFAQHEWEEARAKSNFSQLRPWLEKNLELARQEAQCYGWAPHEEAWDALADGYEVGMRARDLAALFAPLRERLQSLVGELGSRGARPPSAIQRTPVPVDAQLAFIREVTAAIGFDYRRGRIDTTVHPFCAGSGPGDVRITTRLHEDKFFDALLAAMHEAGHGMYEQGLPAEHGGTPLGRAISLGVHESQSRLWENFVGRSVQFWRWCQPRLAERFGGAFENICAEELCADLNAVEPGLIRVEADECTYNLHIMVRFELERALLSGDLAVADLPYAWNRRYKDYLGVDVPDDARGCLQDVHWAGGAFGYFPTYTLGNLYAAQFFEKARAEISDLDGYLEAGEFALLREWLNTRVHAQGSRFPPRELCEHVTGQPLSPEPLLRHLEVLVGYRRGTS